MFHWFKEDTEIIPDVKPDLGSGVCKLPIKLVIALGTVSPLDFTKLCTIRLLLCMVIQYLSGCGAVSRRYTVIRLITQLSASLSIRKQGFCFVPPPVFTEDCRGL